MADRDKLIAVARQCQLAYKNTLDESGVYPIPGSFWSLSGFNRVAGAKTISAAYPIRIMCNGALPTLEACQFIFLVISVKLDKEIAQEIDKLSPKKSNLLQAQFGLDCSKALFPVLIDDFLQKGRFFQDSFAELLNHLMSKSTFSLDKLIFVRNPPIDLRKLHSGFGVSLMSYSTSGRTETSLSLSSNMARLPFKQLLKSRCAFLHKYFFLDYFSLERDALAHTGWVTFGHFPRFQHTARVPAATANTEDVFPQAMDHITLPLFAYTLFSTLKPFFSNYPARLSVQEPYLTVQKKLKQVIFLSITGERALEYSAFYSGTAPIRAVPSTHTAHIHDGIVIYERKPKDEPIRTVAEGQFSRFLVQDACALFINTDLPAHNGKIPISIPEHTPKLKGQSPIAFMLQSFTDWIEERYFDQFEKAYHKCASVIYTEFLHQYKNAAKELFNTRDIPSKEKFMGGLYKSPFLSYDLMIKDLVRAFEELDERLLLFPPPPTIKSSAPSNAVNKMKTFAQVPSVLAGKPHKHWRITSIAENTPTRAARRYAEFYCRGKALYNQYQGEVSLHIIDYENALHILTDNQKVDPQAAKNSAYLLTALLTYCDFLEQCNPGKAKEFRQRSIQAIGKLCAKGPADLTVKRAAKLFHKYLSRLILAKKIIPLRGDPQGLPVRGWYDGQKKLVCLPYATYFEDFTAYCASEEHLQLPYIKATFQELVLYPKGIVQPKENGSASQYFRPDCKIKVAPASLPSAPAETVIKLSIPALERIYPFSAPVLSELYQLSCTPVKRRAIKPKE